MLVLDDITCVRVKEVRRKTKRYRKEILSIVTIYTKYEKVLYSMFLYICVNELR